MKHILAVLALALAFATPAFAEPTNVVVRVLSRDAKFIGTSMGGAHIVLRNAETGAVLAEGATEGGTGDTPAIMDAQGRRAVLANDASAAFRATLDLSAPTLIEVEASGPQAPAHAAMRVTARQWVVPGRHIAGPNGWVLEIPGFAVELDKPPATLPMQRRNRALVLRARVRMMCGCPIEPGGMWNANGYEVAARVERDGALIDTTPMAYAGETSWFAGELRLREPGAYRVTVFAYDPATGNTGLDVATFTVTR